MDKTAFRIITSLILLVLTLGIYTPGRATSQTAFMPAETVNIAHFFKPPNMNAAEAVRNFNMIVLTNGDYTYRDQLMASGFDSTVPEYFRADSIADPGSCSESPINNQVAYNPGDFCWISQNHPDWFLLDRYGRRITVTSGGDYYRMDPASPGWREFFVERVVASQQQHGWTGLFLDNVEGGLGKFYGAKPVKYPDNASYQAAIAGFLQYLDVNYSQKYGRPIMGNIVARENDSVWFNYLQYLDGAMQERFAVDWNETDYLDATAWMKDLSIMEQTQANGKYVILVAPGNQWDVNRELFAFGTYLLISNGKAAFRYSTDDAYRSVWLYDNYKADLGQPRGARYASGGMWRRDFERGYVVVDPVNKTAIISDGSKTYKTSTFADVPTTYWAYSQVEKVYNAGITGGCGTQPLIYCPTGRVTRDQMAVFLLRAKHGSSYVPPDVGDSSGFSDVARDYWAAPWIKQLAAEGITGGCGNGRYCPSAPVARDQMAVFLLRAEHGSSYDPPAVGDGTGFTDVDKNDWSAPWIKQLAAEGISGGCGNGKFCPASAVTRAEMAVFLVRTFNLP